MPTLSRLCLFVLLSLMPLGVTGCGMLAPSASGSFQMVSVGLDPAIQINGKVRTAVFRRHNQNMATIILSDLDLEDLKAGRFEKDGQVVCIEMMWRPKAGYTPVDRTATNCTVRQVIFVEDEIGVYEGAGFLAPNRGKSDQKFTGNVSNVNMRIAANTDAFIDRLQIGQHSSSFTALRDDDAVISMTVHLNSETSRRLNRLFYVVGN